MNPKVPPLYQGPLGSVSCAFDGILKRNYARMLLVCSSEEHHGDIWEPRGTLSPLVTNSIPICIGTPLLRSKAPLSSCSPIGILAY